MWGLRSSRTVAIGLALTAFALACVLPVAYMLWSALAEAPNVLRGLAGDARQQGLLANTFVVGLGSAVLATLAGAPLGFVLARVDVPVKACLRIALASPAVLPPYVVALAWIALPSAFHVTDAGVPFASTYSIVGVVIVMAAVFFPLPMLVTEVALRQMNGRLEDAAMLVASRRRTLARITAPLVIPAILSTSLIVMVLAMSEFSVPGLLRVRVFTTEVFTAFAALYDFGRATALALPVLAAGTMCAIAAGVLLTRHPLVTGRTSHRPSPLGYSDWTYPAVVAALVAIAATLVIPIVVLVLDATQSTTFADIVRGSGPAVLNTLIVAGSGATAVTALAALLAYARSGLRSTAAAAVDALWVALFCVPSTVIGIGLIEVWNRAYAPQVYGTLAMIVLGYVARLLPIAALVLGAVMRAVPRSHEEAAAAAGASWGRTVVSVLVPELKTALAATWVLAFVLGAGEVGTTLLVAPPGESTLPVRAYTLVANAPPGRLAGLALVQSAIVLCPLVVVAVIVARAEKPWRPI